MSRVHLVNRVHTVKFLASLVVVLLLLTLSIGSAQAKKASTLGLSPGYLIIGSYLIHKDALAEENYQAALATLIDPSGGLYYKSEFADGAWLKIDQAISLADLQSTNLGKLVSQGSIDQLSLTIWIDQAGQITSLQTEEELLQDMAKLEEEKRQLEEEHEAALEKRELIQSVQLTMQAEDVAAQIKFLQAVLDNDQELAQVELKKINNQVGLMEELAIAAPLDDPDEQLEQEGKEEESLDEPVEPGDAEEPEEDEEQESLTELSALLDAKEQVEAELVQARPAEDHVLLAGLEATLKNLEASIVQLRKKVELQKKEEVEASLAELEPDDPKAAELTQQLADILKELSELEKEKYTEEELVELELLGTHLENNIPNTEALPVEKVISVDFPIKFDVPPILTQDRVFIQLRPISESIGAVVIWDAQEKSITISRDSIIIVCYIDSLIAYRNGQPVQLDVPPQLINGRTMVPLRFVIEGLGLDLEWLSETKHIIIKQGKGK